MATCKLWFDQLLSFFVQDLSNFLILHYFGFLFPISGICNLWLAGQTSPVMRNFVASISKTYRFDLGKPISKKKKRSSSRIWVKMSPATASKQIYAYKHYELQSLTGPRNFQDV